MYQKKSVLVLFILLSLAVVVAGCGSSQLSPPGPSTYKLTGRMMAPAGTPGGSLVSSRFFLLNWLDPVVEAVTGTVAIPGAGVEVLQLPDLTSTGITTVTDSHGRYELALPSGGPFIIVATKTTLQGDEIRMSTFVEDLNRGSEADIDAATSLATEAFAAKVMSDPTYIITGANWETARQRALHFIHDELDPADLSTLVALGGGAYTGLIGHGLTAEFSPITDQVPDQPDSDVGQAKAMVQSLRDAGYSMAGTLESQIHEHSQNLSDLAPSIRDLAVELGRAIDRIDDMLLIEGYGSFGSYTEVSTKEEWYDYCHWLECNDSWAQFQARFERSLFGPNDRYSLKAKYGDGVYTLDQDENELLIKADGDELDYDIRLAALEDGPGGILSYVGYYAHLKHGELDFLMEGDVHARTYVQDGLGEISPNDVIFEGQIKSVNPHIVLSGTMEVSYERNNPELWGFLSEAFNFSGKVETPTFELDGTFEIELFYDEYEFDDGVNYGYGFNQYPVNVLLTGLLSDRQGTELSGLLRIDLDKDRFESGNTYEYVPVTIVFEGDMRTPKYAPIYLETVINWLEPDTVTSSFEYSRGIHTLAGSATVTLGIDGPWNLIVTNEVGLEATITFESNGAVTGSIRKGAKALASIKVALGSIVIDFVDGTFETLG